MPEFIRRCCLMEQGLGETTRLFFWFLRRGQDRLKDRIRVEHSLQLFAVEKVTLHLVVFAGDVIEPAFGFGEVV